MLSFFRRVSKKGNEIVELDGELFMHPIRKEIGLNIMCCFGMIGIRG